jgi:hypothetical protein
MACLRSQDEVIQQGAKLFTISNGMIGGQCFLSTPRAGNLWAFTNTFAIAVSKPDAGFTSWPFALINARLLSLPKMLPPMFSRPR